MRNVLRVMYGTMVFALVAVILLPQNAADGMAWLAAKLAWFAAELVGPG